MMFFLKINKQNIHTHPHSIPSNTYTHTYTNKTNMTYCHTILLILLFSISGSLTTCPSGYPFELDVSIRWFYMDAGQMIKSIKSCLNGTNPDDPYLLEVGAIRQNANTLIMTHGLSPEYTVNRKRFGEEDGFGDLASIWLAKGWNFGIFHWEQLSDNDVHRFMRSESNIYSPAYYTTMEYKHALRNNGLLVYSDIETGESVTDMFMRLYAAHFVRFPKHPDAEIRLGGHSLGGQLIISVAHAISNNPYIADKPDRVFVLDMVISSGIKGFFSDITYCGDTLDIANVLGCYVSRTNATFEFYKSSAINHCLGSSENFPSLIKNSKSAVFVTVNLMAWGDLSIGTCLSSSMFKSNPSDFAEEMTKFEYQMTNQHIYIVPYYLSSIYHAPYQCTPYILDEKGTVMCVPFADEKVLAVSAQMPTMRLRELANDTEKRCYKQFIDANSLDHDASGDLFYISPCKNFNT